MLAELHKTFPGNMAMQSLGSFDNTRWRDLYRQHSNLPGNDLAQVHRYLDLGAISGCMPRPGGCAGGGSGARDQKLRAGPASRSWPNPARWSRATAVLSSSTPRTRTASCYTIFCLRRSSPARPAAARSGIGTATWRPNDLWFQFRRFAETVRDLDPAAEGFEPSMLPHDRLRVYVLRAKDFAGLVPRYPQYLGIRTQKRRKAGQLRGITVDFSPALSGKAPRSVRVYDPWANRWSNAKLQKGKPSFPTSRSIVVRMAR